MPALLRGQLYLPRGLFRRAGRVAGLGLVLALAFALRVYDLNWDQSRNLHPDERYVAVLAGLIRPPADLGEYFDSGRSPLNPFNTDWGRSYVYGTLPLFLGRYLGEFFDAGCGANGAPIPRALGQLIFGEEAADCAPGQFVGYALLTLVGRFMSALADTLTVLVVFLLGRQLFGARVGLLAAALSALTVLNIQQAHYFTVDASANLFVALNLLFSARLAMARLDAPGAWRGFLANAALAGLAAGLAVACKISTWPTAALLIVSIGVALWRSRAASLGVGVSAVLLAGVLAFGAFRVAQPYAFIGTSALEREQTLVLCQAGSSPLSAVCRLAVDLPDPLRALVAPSGRWIQQLYLAQGFVNGTIDAPFGIQWADRMPLVFPLVNLVFWGMGLALGVTSVVGFFYAARQLWLGRRWWAYLPLVVWVGGYFLYQGAQWTKSIRYLLPIYPALSVLAAHVLVSFWRRVPTWAAQGSARAALRLAALAPTILVVLGTALWARAFLHIYDGEITRVQASRWVYEHVPTAITFEWRGADGRTHQRQVPVQDVRLEGELAVSTLALRLNRPPALPPGEMLAPSARLNYLQGSGVVEARLIEAASGETVAHTRRGLSPDQPVLSFPEARLQPDREYFLELRLLGGGPLSARTSVVANEHWDDAVPQPLDGRNPYGEYYRGLSTSSDGQMQNYNDDTPDKLAQMLDWLDEADYLVLSSNRLYGSIPRLPWRYPMTTRYYRALMSGELGFELAADFHAFPRLGPFLFNSQEMPQRLVRAPNTQGTPPGIFVPYPTAEEAFSVYDHPRVLIFRKTPRYSRERAERILGAADFAVFMRRSPLESANAPGGLLLDDHTLADQQAGGTWRALFPRESPLNRSQPLAVLAWLALTKALGLAAFMLLFPALRVNGRLALVDGGYAAAQTLGWLIPSWLLWILASARVLPFTPTAIWGVMGAFVVVGFAVGHLNREAILAFVRARWRALLVAEGLALFAFGFFLLIRAGNPDLWHPYMGGEKPMDFAYFNAILKATWFPPQDPWFAGGYINYYYFGWVMVGAPVKALGIDPAVAYNLVIPSLFSLTAVGAFGLGASFYAALRRDDARGATLAGLLATALAVFLGNGDEIRVLSPAWQRLGGVEQGVPPALAFINGFVRWVGGAPLPIYPNWPYWNPTRPAPEVWIAEFPLFTFLYADLHAHMMAMPLAYLTVAFALAFAAGARGAAALGLGALAAGMLWPTNSWDYPPYLLLALAGIWLSALREVDRARLGETLWLAARRAVLLSALFFALTRVVMIPYLTHYGSAYNALDRWEGERTQPDTFITIYALFMIPLAFDALRWLADRARRPWALAALGAGGVAGAGLALGGVPIGVLAAPMAALALLRFLAPSQPPEGRLLGALTFGAWALTIFVELFVLRGDVARMNTVFKLYIQAWLLLAVAAGVSAASVIRGETSALIPHPLSQRERGIGGEGSLRRVYLAAFWAAFGVAAFLAALYPIFAIPAKVNDRYTHDAPRGLDGMAYMRFAERVEAVNEQTLVQFPLRHDYDAIRWLQDNVDGSPTILEGTTGGALYRWGNRYSIYTGLPAVIGWQWHQRQQRAALQNDRVIYRRDDDVALFYRTPDPDFALFLLERYRPRYVIVGPLERAYYGTEGLGKFELLVASGTLRVAYQNEGVTIYEVVERGNGGASARHRAE